MNNKILNKILELKNNKKTIIDYVNIFKNNEKSKEVYKDNADFKSLSVLKEKDE